MTNLLAFGDKVIGSSGGGSSDVASKIKLKRDEWVNIPTYDDYTNYYYDSLGHLSIYTYNDITIESGTVPIDGTVVYNVGTGWSGLVFTISDASIISQMIGKTIEFGAIGYDATFVPYAAYATLRYKDGNGDHYIHLNTTGEGSESLSFNTSGVAIQLLVPDDCEYIMMYYVSNTHASITTAGTLTLTNAYAFDINEIPMPDTNNTKVEFNRYDNRPLTFPRNTINLIKSDKKIVSTDNNGNQVEFGGSDGVLPHLVVISESGSTVTASKDGVTIELEETSTDHFECDLNMPNPQDVYGIWSIDALLNGQDAQVSLNVDTIKKYIVDDEHFHASITVTYPSNATVSCGKTGETPMYATESPYTFVVHSTGTYIITGERDGSTEVQTVHITANGQEKFVTLTVVPDGSIATPIDSVPVWLKCAGIEDKDYTEVSEVLADDDTLLTVLTNSNATDYLVRSTTFITDIVADETAMAYIGAYDYASDTLTSNNSWNEAICKSNYINLVYNDKIIPDMTSNSTPTGVASASSIYGSGYEAYRAMDGDPSTYWHISGQSSTGWLKYNRPQAKKPKVMVFKSYYYSGHNYVKRFTLYASNSDSDYNTIIPATVIPDENKTMVFPIDNDTNYSYYYLYMDQTYYGAPVLAVTEFKLYGREVGGVQTWLHSAGIYNKHYTTLAEVLLDTSTLAALMASNDAVDYLVTAKSFIDDIVADEHAMKFISANDYASNTLLDDNDWAKGIASSTYYAYILYNVVPKMTSNTTPSGTCTSSTGSYADNVPWRAFDRDDTTKWVSNTSPEYVQYQFPDEIKYKIYAVSQMDYNTNGGQTWNLQGSNDGTNFTTLATYSSVSHGTTQRNATTVHSEFNIFRLQTPNNYGVMGVSELALMSHMNGGVQSWLHSAGIYNKLYTTVSEVASDVATMNTLMSNHIAVAYLRSAKGLIEDITTNEIAMKYIGAYDYASSELLSDADWCEGIYKSGYKNYVLNVSAPTMTSDKTPSGEVIYSSYHISSNQYGWYAFDKNNATQWSSNTNLFNGTEYIGYKFEFDFKAYRATYTQRTYSGDAANITIVYQGSDDNVTWNDISQTESVVMIAASSPKTYVTNLSAIHEYKYYRILYLSSDGTKSIYPTVAELNFYGRHTGAVQDWLHSANITDKTYATITELANDKTTVMALMRNENALSYLVTAYGLIDEICSNQTMMGAIGSFDHVTDVLLANEVWLVGISNSEFRELVYNVKVPTMTNNTTPKGVARSSSVYQSQYQPYLAFDGNDNSNVIFLSAASVNAWLEYEFEKPVKIFAVKYIGQSGLPERSPNGYIKVSDDGINYNNLKSINYRAVTSIIDTIPNPGYYKIYRICNATGTSDYLASQTLQFYGRETGAIQSWLNAAEIYDKNYTTLSELASDGTTLSTLISNHDASDYLVTAKGLIDGICSNPTIMAYIGLNNYCSNKLLSDSAWCKGIMRSAYMESILNVRVPVMTSDTTPSGQCFGDSWYTGYPYWYAFDSSTSTKWNGNPSGAAVSTEYIGYIFPNPVEIYGIKASFTDCGAASSVVSAKVCASNDGTTWSDVSEVFGGSASNNIFAVVNTAGVKYTRYKMQQAGGSNGMASSSVQFYGREDV